VIIQSVSNLVLCLCVRTEPYPRVETIDIEIIQNRLLKVFYVPAARAGLPRLLFFAAAINSTNEAKKAGGMHH
jgi:hypothetical protein